MLLEMLSELSNTFSRELSDVLQSSAVFEASSLKCFVCSTSHDMIRLFTSTEKAQLSCL